jgi:hypothetical protein
VTNHVVVGIVGNGIGVDGTREVIERMQLLQTVVAVGDAWRWGREYFWSKRRSKT